MDVVNKDDSLPAFYAVMLDRIIFLLLLVKERKCKKKKIVERHFFLNG